MSTRKSKMSPLVMAPAISFLWSVRRLFSSVWIHERRVNSRMNISHAFAKRTGASAAIICCHKAIAIWNRNSECLLSRSGYNQICGRQHLARNIHGQLKHKSYLSFNHILDSIQIPLLAVFLSCQATSFQIFKPQCTQQVSNCIWQLKFFKLKLRVGHWLSLCLQEYLTLFHELINRKRAG